MTVKDLVFSIEKNCKLGIVSSDESVCITTYEELKKYDPKKIGSMKVKDYDYIGDNLLIVI